MANGQLKLSFKLGVESDLPSSGNIEAGTLYLSKQEETYDKRARLYYGDNSTTLLPISDIQTLPEGNQGLCLKGATSVRGGMLLGEVDCPFNHAIELGTTGKNELNFYEYSGIFNFYQHIQDSAQGPSHKALCGSIKPNGFHGGCFYGALGYDEKKTNGEGKEYVESKLYHTDSKYPIYFNNGIPTPMGYSLEKSVPSDAEFYDTKVTSADNHYTPSADDSSTLYVDASGSTSASWGSTSLVTGIDLQRDSKGHVTGITVDSVKMPKNPDKNTTYSAGTGLSLNSNHTFNLKAATTTTLGGIKSGNDIDIATDGAVTVNAANKVKKSLKFGSKNYDGSTEQTITAADLGLSGAMIYLGQTSTAIADGSVTQSIQIGSNTVTATNGNVVIYSNKEFVWNGSSWELLGEEGSYKVKQIEVSSPSTSGNSTAFIDTITQDTNGNISATKKNIPTNEIDKAGLIPAPTSSNKNKVWRTDEYGNPSWKELHAATETEFGGVRMSFGDVDDDFPTTPAVGQIYFQIVS